MTWIRQENMEKVLINVHYIVSTTSFVYSCSAGVEEKRERGEENSGLSG